MSRTIKPTTKGRMIRPATFVRASNEAILRRIALFSAVPYKDGANDRARQKTSATITNENHSAMPTSARITPISPARSGANSSAPTPSTMLAAARTRYAVLKRRSGIGFGLLLNASTHNSPTMFHFPNRSGISRQGAPVRNRHAIASLPLVRALPCLSTIRLNPFASAIVGGPVLVCSNREHPPPTRTQPVSDPVPRIAACGLRRRDAPSRSGGARP